MSINEAISKGISLIRRREWAAGVQMNLNLFHSTVENKWMHGPWFTVRQPGKFSDGSPIEANVLCFTLPLDEDAWEPAS